MDVFSNDITRKLISTLEVRQRIGMIFPDSVILDNEFNIVSISQNILESTGYSRCELLGTCVDRFANRYDLKAVLEEKLRGGFFENEQMEIVGKNAGSALYSVSGFYFGLVTDVNGLIVLKFKNIDEINFNYESQQNKITELDNFVYLSAHALRGPLATIKGLINLSKISRDVQEINFLVNQMETFSEKLDEKLHRLIYFAESDKGYESSDQPLDFETVCKILATEIQEISISQRTNFRCEAQDRSISFPNGEVTLSLLRNLTLFFCQQPKVPDNLLTLDVHCNQNAMEIVLRATGFVLSESIHEKLKSTNFGYTEILNHPELLNCYSAKKIIFRLKGNIQFITTTSADVVVLITFPK